MFTLTEALDAIKDKPEFSVKERGDFTVIDYNLNSRETFVGKDAVETEILCNLRGTAFDPVSGVITRLSYQKFFNYGEFPEVDATLNFNDSHLITQKLDGSMCAPIYTESGFVLGTRAGVTDVSKLADDFVAKSDIRYNDFILECSEYWCTPIFEFCSRANRVVIDYPEPMLVLTGIRFISSGEYCNYRAITKLASFYGVPVVKKINSIVQDAFKNFQSGINKEKNSEGVVIRFESGSKSGHMLKIKSAEYVLKHRAMDQLKFAKDVLLLELDGLLDDVMPLLSEEVFKKVYTFADDFSSAISVKYIDILNEYSKFAEIESQKEFALAILNNPYKQFLFGIRGGKNCFDMLLKYCKVNCGTQAKCEELQKFLGMSVKYE